MTRASGFIKAFVTVERREPTGVCGCCAMQLFADSDALYLLYRSATRLTHRDIYLLHSMDPVEQLEDAAFGLHRRVRGLVEYGHSVVTKPLLGGVYHEYRLEPMAA
jgi:hypothetical protein